MNLAFEKCDQCGKLIAQDYMKHHKKLHLNAAVGSDDPREV